MKQIANIPMNFAANWARANADTFPEAKYIITLCNKGLKTLDEVFSEPLKDSKKLRDLRDFLAGHSGEIESAYVASETVTIIPPVVCETMAGTLREFAACYAAILEKRSEKDSRRAELFRKYYVRPDLPVRRLFSREDIARITELSTERIRQILCVITDELRRILLGETVGRIAAHPVLVDWFRGVDARIGEVISMSKLRTVAGCSDIDPFTERLLCDLLQLTVSKNKTAEQMACRGNLKSFLGEKGKVTKFFRNAGIPVSDDEFTLFLRETFEDKAVQDQLRDYVMTSSRYEITMENGRVKTIALRWEYLDAIGSEIARILYDNAVFTNDTAWHRRDIAAAYNRRAQLHCFSPMMENTPFSHPMVISCGKSGYYRLGGINDKFIDGLSFARDYVIRKGSSATLAEFRALCASMGYTHIYGERSIDTFFFMANKPYAGKPHTFADDAQVLEAVADILRENGNGMRISHLQAKTTERLGGEVSYGRFVKLLSEGMPGKQFQIEKNGRNNVVVRLIESESK